jgi:hypothetical protein
MSPRHDPHEHEADRVADVVARGGSVASWSFCAASVSSGPPVQRQEKPKSDEEKKKEALTKAGEAALETPAGKALKEKVLADPVVKAVSETIASPGGLAAIGIGVAGLAVAGQPLPVQPPAIKLDRIVPGLSAEVTWKGPVAAPTQVGLVLTFKEQGPKAGPKKSETDRQREENAKLAAADAAFRRGMTYAPGTKEAAEQQADEEAIKRYVTSRIGALPGFGSPLIPLRPGPQQRSEGTKAEEKKKPEDAPVQRSATATAKDSAASYDTSVVDAVVARPGDPIEAPVRGYMERRFGYDFSAVRVHHDPESAGSALALDAEAYTTGRHIVFAPGRYDPSSTRGRRLIAHELAHVVQQSASSASPRGAAPLIRRKVIIAGTEMTAKERETFLRGRKWANAAIARAVLDDMAAAKDPFDFSDTAELTTEVVKRTSTSLHMQDSQDPVPGDKSTAFGYPFSGAAALYGPRVNYAARDLWKPAPPDNYAVRTDKVRNKRLVGLPRNQRHTVYGDMGYDYHWVLTDKGKNDCHSAVALMFTRQSPHQRALVHCDYLISLVNFLSLADAVGKHEFNKRIAAWGADKIVLRSLLFTDLEPIVRRAITGGTTLVPGIKSTQAVSPSSQADLVIGDHVMFFNHLGYDLINKNIGNAWRLENAVLVARPPKGADIFLGHGSGRKTDAQMRAKLAEEFNDVARQALGLTARAESKDKKTAAAANAELARRFPDVKRVGADWRIVGVAPLAKDMGCTVQVDEKLRTVKADEIPGLKNPCKPARLYEVRRPIESAKGKP